MSGEKSDWALNAISDAEWQMRVRVAALRLYESNAGHPQNIEEARQVIAGILEDLQSGFELAKDAFAMLALSYALQRDPDSDAVGDAELFSHAIESVAEAIARDSESPENYQAAYVQGFINGLAAAVKNIHMNA